jgi:hypothetical protein
MNSKFKFTSFLTFIIIITLATIPNIHTQTKIKIDDHMNKKLKVVACLSLNRARQEQDRVKY